MWRQDTDGLCAACPVRKLGIGPARECENSGAGESDMACRAIGIGMRQGFERIIRVAESRGERYQRGDRGGVR